MQWASINCELYLSKLPNIFVKIATITKCVKKYICEDGALISSSSSLALALQHYALGTGDPSRPHLDASSHLLFLSSPHLVLQRLWNAIFSEGNQQFLLPLIILSRFAGFFGTCLVLSETWMFPTSDWANLYIHIFGWPELIIKDQRLVTFSMHPVRNNQYNFPSTNLHDGFFIPAIFYWMQ